MVVAGASTAEIVDAMSEPRFYPHAPESVELVETHISFVFLAGARVYKLKKPVVLPFLDYGTRGRRRLLCAEEVRLNRRLAPRLYLGVRSLVRSRGHLELGDEADPDAIDYVVEMKRLPEERTLARMIAAGAASRRDLAAVGARLADFHRHAQRAGSERGSPVAIKRTYDETYETLLSFAEERLERHVVAGQRFSDAFVAAHRELLEERRDHVRDGHGDLRAEHVVFDGEVEVFDCVEFDPALRQTDVASDLAFLVMDLEARGAPELAAALVTAYRGGGGEDGGDRLLAFYASQHALVRAKVALLRPPEGPQLASLLATAGPRPPEGPQLASLLATAERFRWRARAPLLLVVCGPAASGKSTLARLLSERSGLPVFSSDIIRKELAGLAATDRGAASLYTESANRRTYRELGRRAARAEHGAIIDATCRLRADRDELRAGLGEAGGIVHVECRAPTATRVMRARRREALPGRTSDATATIAASQAAEFEPLDEVAAAAHLAVRSDRDPARVADDVEALLDSRALDD